MNDVVITGLGTVSPIGINTIATLDNAKQGNIGINDISKFNSQRIRSKFDAEVNDSVLNEATSRELRRLDTAAIYALIAAREAMKDSKITQKYINGDQFQVVLGNGFGGINTVDNELKDNKISPFFITKVLSNMLAATLAKEFKAEGSAYTINTACASSTDAIGQAFLNIREGRANLALAGGTEASLNEFIFSGFESIHALSLAGTKENASIPFDVNRTGFVMGEGAGILVLEEKQHALARNAPIYGEITGYGSTNDAFNTVLPEPDGNIAAKAIDDAIRMSQIEKKQIKFISAHGTSTGANDKTETKILKKVFGDKAADLTVSSLKGLIGHTLGASGAIETVISLLMLKNGIIPGTFGVKNSDPECDLNYSPNSNSKGVIDYFIKESFGFGGHNAALCLKVGNDFE